MGDNNGLRDKYYMKAKTVNENQQFQRGQDPLNTIGIGRHVQVHKGLSQFFDTVLKDYGYIPVYGHSTDPATGNHLFTINIRNNILVSGRESSTYSVDQGLIDRNRLAFITEDYEEDIIKGLKSLGWRYVQYYIEKNNDNSGNALHIAYTR
jgi:hypothetical protein